MGSLSERDRHRLAELLRAPLVPPRVPAKPLPNPGNWLRPKESLHPVENKAPAQWNARATPALNGHFAAHRRQWVAGTAVLGFCLVIAGLALKVGRRPELSSIQLQALDREGQLRIQWDPNSDLIRRAVSAKLFITDGTERLFVTLDSAQLRRGAVSYTRRNDRVDLRLALAEPDGKFVEQAATYLGTRPERAAQPPLEAVAKPVAPPTELPTQSPAPPPVATITRTVQTPREAPVIQHRARRMPLEQSGTHLPFTCAPGDVFRKTDAPAGWDTFTCRSRNVWSLTGSQPGEDRSASKPNPSATKLTAKPAKPSTM